MTATSEEWADKAKRFLRGEMAHAGVKNADLAKRLTEMGLPETEGSVQVKINRGGVSSMVPASGSKGGRIARAQAARTRLAWPKLAVVPLVATLAIGVVGLSVPDPAAFLAGPYSYPPSNKHHTYSTKNDNRTGFLGDVAIWATSYHDAIEALAGIASVAFTGILTYSTIGLWKETRRLAEDAEDQLGALEESVKHAGRSANASVTSSNAATKSVNLLADVERAYLWFGLNDLMDAGENLGVAPGGRQVNFTITVGNGGRTAGMLKRLWFGIELVEPSGMQPVYERGNLDLTMDLVISAGAKIDIITRRIIVRHAIFVVGFLEYEDVFRNRRLSRFCGKIVANPIEFGAAGPPAWNEWT